jgi:hypothetical protein
MGFLEVDVFTMPNPEHGHLSSVIVYTIDGPVISYSETVTFASLQVA